MKKNVKTILRNILTYILSKRYNKKYKNLLKRNNIQNKYYKDENIWINKWSVLGKANPIYYRLFSKYIGNDVNIISEDICRNIVEPILDPLRYVSYYADKNIFDKLFVSGTLPKTILRKINRI